MKANNFKRKPKYSLRPRNGCTWGAQVGLGSAFVGFLFPAFFIAAIYFLWSSVMKVSKEEPPLFFCSLNLSMMTPTRRLRVKNAPNTMKATKYMYWYRLFS